MQGFQSLILLSLSLLAAAPATNDSVVPLNEVTIRPVVSLVLASLDDELVAAALDTVTTAWIITVPDASGVWQSVATGLTRALHGRAQLPSDTRLERLTFQAPRQRNDTLFASYRRSTATLCGGMWVEVAHRVEMASLRQTGTGTESWGTGKVLRRIEEPVMPCGDLRTNQDVQTAIAALPSSVASVERALIRSVLSHLRGYMVVGIMDSVPHPWTITVPYSSEARWQNVQDGIARWMNARSEGAADTTRNGVSFLAPRTIGETMEFVITTSGHRLCGDGSWRGSVGTFREIAERARDGSWTVQKGSVTYGDGFCRRQ